ncbi:MAG: hypothetical protein M1562_00460 [Candidatus Marsarchaeota archaeon]|jgi:hypothetical protein|nr:hypothetical protein [Candidatus Marsarchaeota archaeon]
MRLQTTLEFIILLGVIAAMATVIFGIYTVMQKKDNSALNTLFASYNHNVSVGQNAATHNLSVNIYIPYSIVVGESTPITALFSGEGNFSISNLSLSSYNASVLTGDYNKLEISNPYLLSFNIVPDKKGLVGVVLNGSFYNNGSMHRFSVSAESYAYLQNVSGKSPQNYSVNLKDRYENVLYNTSLNGSLYNVSESSHCAYTNFEGFLYKIKAQCGSNAAWDFFVNSSECYYGAGTQYRAYCFYKNSENSDLYSVNQNRLFNFSVSLVISNDIEKLNATLTRILPESPLYSPNGTVYGNASVYGYISGDSASPNPYLLVDSVGTYSIINYSDYNRYSQYLNSLTSMLSYYNQSKISSSSEYAAMSAMGVYDQYVSGMISAHSIASGCTLITEGNNYMYECPPISQFTFSNITAYIDGYNGSTTVDSSGSFINIK